MTTEDNATRTRRWFTEGWVGNFDLADGLFAANLHTNGKQVSPEGAVRTVCNRLTGFPDLQVSLEELVAVDDTVIVRIKWRGTHLGKYSGVEPTGKSVEVMTLSIWHFKDGLMVKNWTITDQFSLFQQLGVISPTLQAAQVPAPPAQDKA